MIPLLRNVLEGYRRIILWAARLVAALAVIAATAAAIVWPLWMLSTHAPTLYAAIAGALLLGALVLLIARRRRRVRAEGRARREAAGRRAFRAAAAIATPVAAYTALVAFRAGSIAVGVLLALVALVALGAAGRGIEHNK